MIDPVTRTRFSRPDSEAIAALNDRLRTTGTGGRVVASAGLNGRGKAYVALALTAVATFTAFDRENDPYGERDAAMLDVGRDSVLFKIDYYDLSLTAHSPNPADPAVTERVMTVMLAEEY
jgi:hypothetical protein